MNSKVLILGLHRVGNPPKNAKIRGLFTAPRVLKFQLWLLVKLGFRFVTLQDAILNHDERLAVLTFDDGYEDNFTDALPVLESYGAPATIFVVTSDIGKRSVVWSEAAEDLPARMVDWKMLAELQRRGWEVGSHGHQHVHFDRRSDDEQQYLIDESLAEIEKHLGSVPMSFAYPYGAYNATTKNNLYRSGLRYAVTTRTPRPADLALAGDLLELKRVSVTGRRLDHIAKNAARTLRAIGFRTFVSALASTTIKQLVAPQDHLPSGLG